MTTTVDALFNPFSFNGLDVANRIAMAPMTREKSPGGVANEEVAGYYRRRVEGGTGLIITEGTTIDDPVATMGENIPRIHGEAALAGWKHVVDEVHSAGGKIMAQLWHTGMMRNPQTGTVPDPELQSIGPSGLFMPGKPVTEPMTVAQIEGVIAAFAKAAADAKAVGFDGVEIHGAHGYLIDQFFWEGLNQRADEWGGSLAKRNKFAIEIIKAIRAAVGSDYAVGLRYSQWKQQAFEARLAETPQLLEEFLTPLADAGVDLFHCSTRRYWEPEFEGSDLNLAGWTKKIIGKPTMTVGSVGLNGDFVAAFVGEGANTRSLDDLVERLDKGEFDMVAVGRALLQDPQWCNKVKAGQYDQLKDYDAASLATLS